MLHSCPFHFLQQVMCSNRSCGYPPKCSQFLHILLPISHPVAFILFHVAFISLIFLTFCIIFLSCSFCFACMFLSFSFSCSILFVLVSVQFSFHFAFLSVIFLSLYIHFLSCFFHVALISFNVPCALHSLLSISSSFNILVLLISLKRRYAQTGHAGALPSRSQFLTENVTLQT